MLAVLCLLLVLGSPLHAYETTHIWCVLTGRDNLGQEIVRIELAPGQSRAVHLPAGTYGVELGRNAFVSPDNPPPYLGGFASMATGMRFRVFLGGLATQVSWSGGASATADAGSIGYGDSGSFSSLNGTHVASVSASASEDGGNQACGWITQDSWAASTAAGYADSSGISGVIEFRGSAHAASHYPCGVWEAWAECQGTFVASFALLDPLDTIIITDTPPVNGTPLPTLPDQTTPATPGGCVWLPTYGFNNAASGGWFGLPASGSTIQFDALDTTGFTGVTGFPAGTTWVDVAGQSHGPFTSGQSFSFADQPGGSVTTFTVRADAGLIPALTAFQLAFSPDPGSFQAQIVGPADVRIDAERLSAGQPPTQTSPLAVARGESVRFTVHVPGSCASTYQWRRNGVALPGETNPTLNLASVGSEHYGTYSVVVQNESGTAESLALALEPLLYTLTVNAAGGTVTKSPDLAGYEPGTVVTLQAAPAAGFTFAGWDSDLHSTANPVPITMDQSRSVTAWFGNPFGGTPRTIPGRIEAEDFDEGGEGVTYHDADEANQGGSTYRTGGVDVVAGAQGTRIGWSDTGEWLNYTVNAPAAGLYRGVFRVSSGMSGGTARVRFSGGQKPADVAVPGTGSWGTFVDVASEPFSLPAGLQVMRFEYAQAGFDLDWVELQRVNSPPVADAGGPYTIDEGSSLILNGGATDPDLATGDSHTFAWDLNNDGTFGDVTGATTAAAPAQLTALGFAAGTHTIHLRVTDLAGASDTASTTVTIRGTQTITFDPIADRTYGDAPFTINATASSGLPVTFTSLTPSVVAVSGSTVTVVGAGTATIRASQAGDAHYQPATDVERTFTVAKATPVITWATPADITLGTPLSELQLNATANVPGAFT